MQFWILRFDKRMMVLTIQDEGIWRTGDLGFGGCPRLCFLCSRNDRVMSKQVRCWSNLDHTLFRFLGDTHWSLDQVARSKISKGFNALGCYLALPEASCHDINAFTTDDGLEADRHLYLTTLTNVHVANVDVPECIDRSHVWRLSLICCHNEVNPGVEMNQGVINPYGCR